MNGRSDFRAIARWVAPGSTVLDLGCGEGELLKLLRDEHKVLAWGVEIRDSGVLACVRAGLNVLQQDLEGGLALFEDQSFDTVILSQTLQTIHQTQRILREIVRVGREAVVSFPNFGHWTHRLAVLKGRMPVSRALPYQWYDTPNVRVLTLRDFEVLAAEVGLKILDRVVLDDGRAIGWGANWRGSLAVYRVRRV